VPQVSLDHPSMARNAGVGVLTTREVATMLCTPSRSCRSGPGAETPDALNVPSSPSHFSRHMIGWVTLRSVAVPAVDFFNRKRGLTIEAQVILATGNF
jgi:hypothetical protein